MSRFSVCYAPRRIQSRTEEKIGREANNLSVFSKRMFPGGIHPKEGVNGKKVNSQNAIMPISAPPRVIIPLHAHGGAPAKAIVAKGDRVLVGQLIGEAGSFVSANVHSSVSGIVRSVEPALLANGMAVPSVIIDNDFRDEWTELHPSDHPETLTADELRQIVRDAGIVGMGGAAFPNHVKITPSAGKNIDTLVINGVECEPYLTADHRLMLEKSVQIIDGVRLIMQALGVSRVLIGIEENKADAVDVLTRAASGLNGVKVVALPVRYPQGGEKQLIYALTRRVVPVGGLPIDTGCVVMNVGTVYAVQQAIREGKPVIERVVTVGGMVNNPANFLVRIGTPAEHLISACGGMQPGVRQLICGGPMMGMALSRLDIPVTKGCSGFLALRQEAMEAYESPCIHCGRCVRACPMKLTPYRMDAYVRKDMYEEAEKSGVMNCLECGACTFVCPAKRCLTQSCRTAKKVIRTRRSLEAARKKEG